MLLTVLETIVAIAIPWYGGAVIVGALFPALPRLGQVGIGWGIGLGGVTWLMFALSLLHIPFTGATIAIALIVCFVAFAWIVRRFDLIHPDDTDAVMDRGAAPAWLRWPMIALTGFVLALCAILDTFWPVADWDALAAYDLRGHAFALFNSTTVAAHHGDLSYSFWLPPFTSLGHTLLYESAGTHAPVKWLYVTCFAALIAAFI